MELVVVAYSSFLSVTHFCLVKFDMHDLACLIFGILMYCIFQAITASGAKKGELILADVNTKLINKNITTDLKVDTNSKVSNLILSSHL